MQFLIFHLGKDRYGLNTQDVIRVMPLLELKQIPKAPGFVSGLMNLHGEPVPVIDLCALAHGTPCTAHFDTRIVLLDYRTGSERHMLGVVAERVSGVENVDMGAFVDPGLSNEEAPFLGKVAADNGPLLQLIHIEHLLTEEARNFLYPNREQALP